MIAFACFAVLPLALRAGELREWNVVTGEYKIEAEYRSSEGENVVLVTADGKELTLPLAGLSKADQDFVEGQKGENELGQEDKSREWSDSTGKHKIVAKYRGLVSDKRVVLMTHEGAVLEVPLAKLSETDQEFVQSEIASTSKYIVWNPVPVCIIPPPGFSEDLVHEKQLAGFEFPSLIRQPLERALESSKERFQSDKKFGSILEFEFISEEKVQIDGAQAVLLTLSKKSKSNPDDPDRPQADVVIEVLQFNLYLEDSNQQTHVIRAMAKKEVSKELGPALRKALLSMKLPMENELKKFQGTWRMVKHEGGRVLSELFPPKSHLLVKGKSLKVSHPERGDLHRYEVIYSLSPNSPKSLTLRVMKPRRGQQEYLPLTYVMDGEKLVFAGVRHEGTIKPANSFTEDERGPVIKMYFERISE